MLRDLAARLALAALLAAPALARAEEPDRAPLPGKHGRDFWSWLGDGHRPEVDLILRKAGANKAQALHSTPFDPYQGYDPARAAMRERLLADAEGMLRYARRLAPDNLDVLRELALVSDENGRPGARALLERYLEREAPERAAAEARLRLGRWYARERRWREAVVQLRLALGGRPADARTAATARVLLASIYMQTNRLGEAIELLRGALVGGPGIGYPPDYATPFALAVAYDRDEQITLAHETLERLAAMGPEALSMALGDGQGGRISLVPPEERHYFAALQYEVLGLLVEARAEWQAYLRWEQAPYRARARQHLAAVDRLLREQGSGRAPVAAPPPSPFGPMPLGVP